MKKSSPTPKVTHDEIVSVASSSYVRIEQQQMEPFIADVEDMLNYARLVQDFKGAQLHEIRKNKNIFRADIVQPCNPQELLQRGPSTEGSYFVVPIILENR